MARPSTPAYGGADGRTKWEQVEDLRKSSQYTTVQMAEWLGMASDNAYRSFRRRGLMPFDTWARFEAAAPLKDHEERLDEAAQRYQLLASARSIGKGEDRQALILKEDLPPLLLIQNGEVLELDLPPLPICAHPACNNPFHRNSWNHKYCNLPTCKGTP